MNKKIIILVLILAVVVLGGWWWYSNSQKKTTTENPEKKSTKSQTEEKVTAKESYNKIKSKIDETLKEKNARLGKVVAEEADKDGRAFVWSFEYYVDNAEKPNYTELYSFIWSKGNIEDYQDEIFSEGLDTADYDYIWKDIGNNWVDSSAVTKKEYENSKDKEDWSTRISLFWNSDINKDAPTWFLNPNYLDGKKTYYSAESGEKIK